MFGSKRAMLALVVAASCCVAAVSSATLIELLEWGLVGKGAEVRAEGDEAAPGGQRNCLCDGPSCICCIDFNLTYVDLGGPGCVRMKYLSQDEGFAVNVSYGNSLLHSQTVRGPDPEPTCMNIIPGLAQLCARLTELAPTGDGLRGCLQLEPQLLKETQFEFPLGCFRSGPGGMTMEPSKTNATNTNDVEEESETTEPDSAINTEDIIQAVNESAEQGIAFFTSLLGLTFGKTNSTKVTEDVVPPPSVPVEITPQPMPTENQKRSPKSLLFNSKANEV